MNNENIENQTVIFSNRLTKRYNHLRKWAKRTQTTCYRLYDRDIPEVPLAVDLYTEDPSGTTYLHIYLYERPYEKSDEAETEWMAAMSAAAEKALSIPKERIFTKIRRKQRGAQAQYEKISHTDRRIIIAETDARFLINLDDYLDTGLFLDHRPMRFMVRDTVQNKSVLNLFCYTGSFTVHAALGGARAITSVDLSNTYLAWAQDNMNINGFGKKTALTDEKSPQTDAPFELHRSDVTLFLRRAIRSGEKWDCIICDPPTFSNSKKLDDVFDINRDWAELCRLALAVLSPGGTLWFSTNSRKLKFDPSLIGGAAVHPGTIITDLSEHSIPEDFRNQKIHRLWSFSTENTEL
ncbi:MAG TPA: rRNA (guanine-N2)-methyltransferase [Treponema sp.]|nr:rRNA (guanine-N2)-methyltransferase [Treponema sp.]